MFEQAFVARDIVWGHSPPGRPARVPSARRKAGIGAYHSHNQAKVENFVVEMTEHRLRAAAAYLVAGGVLCFFGIIHSVRADGSAYALWQLDGSARLVAGQFCAAYVALAAALLLLSIRGTTRR